MWPAKLKLNTEGSVYSPFSASIHFDLSKINKFIKLVNGLKFNETQKRGKSG